MGKTWAAGALLILAVGPATLLAADPAVRRVGLQQSPSGTEYLPAPKSVSDATTLSSTDSATTVPTSSPTAAVPAVPDGGSGCAGCAGAEPAHQHFTCIRHLCRWFTYCPLKKGVNCETCRQGYGECCCYHCFPPLYLFFREPCMAGYIPTAANHPCGCGRAGAVAAGTTLAAPDTTTAPAGTDNTTTSPARGADGPALSKSPPAPKEHTSFFGTTRMFSLSTGFGCSGVGSH